MDTQAGSNGEARRADGADARSVAHEQDVEMIETVFAAMSKIHGEVDSPVEREIVYMPEPDELYNLMCFGYTETIWVDQLLILQTLYPSRIISVGVNSMTNGKSVHAKGALIVTMKTMMHIKRDAMNRATGLTPIIHRGAIAAKAISSNTANRKLVKGKRVHEDGMDDQKHGSHKTPVVREDSPAPAFKRARFEEESGDERSEDSEAEERNRRAKRNLHSSSFKHKSPTHHHSNNATEERHLNSKSPQQPYKFVNPSQTQPLRGMDGMGGSGVFGLFSELKSWVNPFNY